MRWAALLLSLLVAGCVSLGGSPAEVHEYDLLPDEVAAGSAMTTTLSLQLEPFGVSEALDRDGIVWRRGAAEIGAYTTQRWARPPQQAVRDFVAAALHASLSRAAIGVEPPLADPDFVLRGYLSRCEELDEGDHWSGVLELCVVVTGRDGGERLRRTYSGEERALSRNPLGVVEALRRVLGRIGPDVARDVAIACAGRALPGDLGDAR